jgi:hypothetical protein
MADSIEDVIWRIDNEAAQFIDEKGMVYLRYLRDRLTPSAPLPEAGEDVPFPELPPCISRLKINNAPLFDAFQMHQYAMTYADAIQSARNGGEGDGPGCNAERHEDMSPTGRLRLFAQDDGDMGVMVIEDDGTSATVEFCASGGRSPRTLQALRDLSRAMRDDAAQRAKGEGHE